VNISQSDSKTLLRFLRVRMLCASVFVSMYRCVYTYVHYTSVCVSKHVLSVTLISLPLTHSLSLSTLSHAHMHAGTHIYANTHTHVYARINTCIWNHRRILCGTKRFPSKMQALIRKMKTLKRKMKTLKCVSSASKQSSCAETWAEVRLEVRCR